MVKIISSTKLNIKKLKKIGINFLSYLNPDKISKARLEAQIPFGLPSFNPQICGQNDSQMSGHPNFSECHKRFNDIFNCIHVTIYQNQFKTSEISRGKLTT